MTNLVALDLFAGTGWGVACQWLGITEYGVDNMPEVVATREANGMHTIFNDVWDGLDPEKWYNPEDPLGGPYDLLIASPPCQTFSMAGSGSGRKALDDVLRLVDSIRTYTRNDATFPADLLRDEAGRLGDDRTALVLTPLLYALRDRPKYIAFEQVPTVQPVWDAVAEVLRDVGYSVWTGKMYAEQYGVPQTRTRSILIARKDGVEAKMPTPTHSKYYPRDPKRLDPGVLPWISMAEALGWGMTERPSMTVTGGGANTGGAEPFAGGASHSIATEFKEGRWEGDGEQLRRRVSADEKYAVKISPDEAAVLQSYPVMRSNYGTSGNAENRGERTLDQPAPTVTSKIDRNMWVAVSSQSVNGGPRAERPVEEPAFTVTSNSDRVRFEDREPEHANEGDTTPLEWTNNRPSPTIVGSFRPDVVAAPGYRKPGDPPRQKTPGSVRVTEAQASALQSFPAFEWKGKKGKVFLQIGNAVPPLLARAVLETFLPAEVQS